MRKNDKKRAAKRAKKKHEKEVARRRAKAERRPASSSGQHEEAASLWPSSRVRALGVEGVVGELAARGIVTEQATFPALAAEHLSCRHLAETEWLPRLSTSSTGHDRDFLRSAATFLWSQWSPELISDEQAELELDAAETQLGTGGLARLLGLWQSLAPGEAPRRLERAGLAGRFARLAATLFRYSEHEFDTASLRSLREALVALGAAVALDQDSAWWLTDALDETDWSLGEGDTIITRHLEAAARGANATRLLEAAAQVLEHDATDAQRARVRDALDAALSRVAPQDQAHALDLLEDLDAALGDSSAPLPT